MSAKVTRVTGRWAHPTAVTQLIVKHRMTTQMLMAMLRRRSTLPMLEKPACLVAWREVMP